LVYAFLSGGGRPLSAGLAGAAIVSIVVAAQYRKRAVKIMDCTSLSYFAAETLTILAGGAAFIRRYHLVLAWGAFAVVSWLTIIVGRPFTLQYTREQMPREVWNDPFFYQMNHTMTEVWSVIFTLGAVLGEIATRYGHRLLLGVIVPMAAMGVGIIFSQLYPRSFAHRFASLGQMPADAASASHKAVVCEARS
jgi:hypothetical protein